MKEAPDDDTAVPDVLKPRVVAVLRHATDKRSGWRVRDAHGTRRGRMEPARAPESDV